MSKSNLSIFSGSLVFTIAAVGAGYALGGWAGAFTVLMLGILETSLSFDNAVVNAGVLKHWDRFWRMLFLTVGMLIAVFGMRLLFPLVIVGTIADMSPVAVFNMALEQPEQYSAILSSAHHEVAAFGGAFLMMVFLKFFLDPNRESFWLSWIEKPLAKMGVGGIYANILLTIGALYTTMMFFDSADKAYEFGVAGLVGIGIFVATKALIALLHTGDGKIIQQGIAGFIYLEIVDIAFSFDGVIGAFAVTNQFLLIALGLGVGAMFVRSFTILLVEKGTLDKFEYAEAGAYWAIAALCAVMFVGSVNHVSEIVSGLIGATIIGLAFLHSYLVKRGVQ